VSQRKARAFLWGAIVVGSVLIVGCNHVQLVDERTEIEKQLKEARYQSAQRCAPKELAIAEANLKFAELELDAGNLYRARDHVQVANAAAVKAVEVSTPCTPDTDKDGLHDKIDQCPKEPGPKENNGCPWPDTDKDGLTDNVDKCPKEAGPKENNGCPWGDLDKDGVTDNVDKCPKDPEDRDGFLDEDGCPEPDNDKDSVLDVYDRCPMEMGPAVNQGCPVMDRDGDGFKDDVDQCPDEPGIEEYQGCPPADRDNDGVPDHIDRCPDEPGTIPEQGCSKKYTLIVLKTDRIEIKEQVHFANNKHDILKDSFAMLDQIVQALRENPKLRLHIDGHTDSKADDAFNMKLSQKRADSVREYLVKAGIPGERLVAQGFGETVPIASNRTETGRAANRRVEFNIIRDNTVPAMAPPAPKQ
jgi:outer membrane protein OmpA-like peptidoglycan-associated protein